MFLTPQMQAGKSQLSISSRRSVMLIQTTFEFIARPF
ncbi:hypothetical protein [Ralstonia phage RP31]|uniref:Uncharacterized protein n=1 Tax=Ralstonia phage RP31 TaxID=1923890 RepID=A0A1L7N1J7_9CAUD|nr:hypothetical protein [Ralstonia phage RP31]